MWYQLQRTSALAVLMAVLGVAAVGCAVNSSGNDRSPDEAARTTPGVGSEPQPAEAANQIVIDNFTFKPPKVTISVGTKVTWINHDDVPHTATSTAKPRSFDSGTLDTDDRFSHVFATAGTYKYFCAVHPHMTGEIIVK